MTTFQAEKPIRLKALELRGGNDATSQRISVAGFEGFIYSRPHRGDARGGDLSFVSTCAMEQIVRFTLVDLAGHGDTAAAMAERFRVLFKKYINTPNPAKLARALNREFTRLGEAGRFATAVITTYFAPTDHLIVCNAGHPRPLLYHAGADGAPGTWELFDQASGCVVKAEEARKTGISNLPLGVIHQTDYPQFATCLSRGDMVISYTDAFVEARNAHGELLGEQGLLEMVRGLDVGDRDPERIGRALLREVAAFRAGDESDDDESLIVLSHTATNPPDGAWPRILALARVVGIVK
jgi:phosphoserine phosphatase RsbU/P